MNKNKFFSLLLVFCLLVSGCSTTTPSPNDNSSTSKLTPGTYKSTVDGFSGEIELSMEVDENKILKIEVKETETPTLGGAAIKQLKTDVIEKQSLNIDTVAGATISSAAFLKAVEEALSQAGANLEDFTKVEAEANENKEKISLSADLVVVGAGGAGLTASLSAAQGGLDVILLEKMPMAGGASAMAGGGTNATGSKMQRSYGIEDTPEMLFMDLMRNGSFSNHANTTWIYANTVGEAFDWLVAEDGAGLKYKDNEPKPSAEHSVGRTFSPEGAGSGVVTSLLEKVEALGVKVMYETPAKELMTENRVVKGVKAVAKDGTTYEIAAKSVILASGGYGANEELLTDYVRSLAYAGAVSATGDGLLMAQEVGADSINLDKVNIQPHSIVLPDGRGQHTYQGALAMYGGTGSVLVSDKGERFVNEQGSGASIKAKMEENKHSYLIMDEESFNLYTKTCIASKNYTEKQLNEWLEANGTTTPIFAKGDTLEDLAKIIDISGDNLKETVIKYNGFVAKGEDSDFGRKVSKPMNEKGPFYAVEMNLRYYASLGGLRINNNMQVVKADDTPIEGLYAAGEIVGGVLGDIYAPGALFGWAMTSGYNAGNAVVDALNK
ncbi:flavocytochrome c [Tissierella praeacuta]|uniref:flavocytochrome c n=1 Tax=Tissierella praeacuta TaxID=43131 RepID=UPI003341E5B9